MQLETIIKQLPVNEDYYAVHDAGFTQVATMSLTVVGLRPMTTEEVPEFIKTLTLL